MTERGRTRGLRTFARKGRGLRVAGRRFLRPNADHLGGWSVSVEGGFTKKMKERRYSHAFQRKETVRTTVRAFRRRPRRRGRRDFVGRARGVCGLPLAEDRGDRV